jgi:hypothetical protein
MHQIKLHKAHKLTPAMAAGITDRLYSMEDIASMVDASLPVPGKRGPYKKRLAFDIRDSVEHLHHLIRLRRRLETVGDTIARAHRACVGSRELLALLDEGAPRQGPEIQTETLPAAGICRPLSRVLQPKGVHNLRVVVNAGRFTRMVLARQPR